MGELELLRISACECELHMRARRSRFRTGQSHGFELGFGLVWLRRNWSRNDV